MRLSLWQDTVQTDVDVRGSGPPLIYLHGPWGLPPDSPFLDELAQRHTVYAPKHPGTSAGDPEAIHRLDSLHDLVVYYAELFDALQLESAPLVGHSFGGMLACEIAAIEPSRVSRLVLIDPVGLWRDDRPVKNWMILSDQERRSALFADPAGEAAGRFFDVPEEPTARVETLASFTWSQACTGKFVWPLADKGLAKRIHRVRSPTLLIWGNQDGVISSDYADEFAKRIAGARVERIDNAAHQVHLEQSATVARLVSDFARELPVRPGSPLARTARSID
jgi:pimeloyl-ACP methyl ester carboxylesterase